MKSLVEKLRSVGMGTAAAVLLGGFTAFTEPVYSTTNEMGKNKIELTAEETSVLSTLPENTIMLDEIVITGHRSYYVDYMLPENTIMLDEVVIIGQKPDSVVVKKSDLPKGHNNYVAGKRDVPQKFGPNRMMPNMMHGKTVGNESYAMMKQHAGMKQRAGPGRMMQERMLDNKEQTHKLGYVTVQTGDYNIGRIETPKETIIYKLKTSDLANNAEKKKLLTNVNDLIKQYNLKQYDAKEIRPDFQDKEKGRNEYRHSLEDFKNGMRRFDSNLEKKIGSLDKFESVEMDHKKMAEHFKQYGRDVENKSKEWEKYAREHKDSKDFRKHPDINKWQNDMHKWSREDLGKWQNDAIKYMQRNVEKKTFSDGEFYIKIQKNDSLGKYFPMPPAFPRPPMQHGNYHR